MSSPLKTFLKIILIAVFAPIGFIYMMFIYNWCFNNLMLCFDPTWGNRPYVDIADPEVKALLEKLQKEYKPTLWERIMWGIYDPHPNAGVREIKQSLRWAWDFLFAEREIDMTGFTINEEFMKVVLAVEKQHKEWEPYRSDLYMWLRKYDLNYLLPESLRWKHIPYVKKTALKTELLNKMLMLEAPRTLQFTDFHKNITTLNAQDTKQTPFVFYFFVVLLWTAAIATVSAPYLTINGIYVLSASALLLFFSSLLVYLPEALQYDKKYSLTLKLYPMFNFLNNLEISLGLDKVTAVFCFLITAIALGAIAYSKVYLTGDPHPEDFVIKLLWFVISMLSLVMSRNVLWLYFSWEFIGITSMWLINFYSHRTETVKSALKAFTFNKISDLCLFAGLLIGLAAFSSPQIDVWVLALTTQTVSGSTNEALTSVCAVLIVLAASIKSAQIGFHIWLPDSMDAPVPASALIHSATLVSAGVYLLLRFEFLMSSTGMLTTIGFLGATTAAYGGIVAATQTNLKKALAYSTISHCGFLFVCVSFGNVNATLLYLCLHGFFKALSFICVGEVIRSSGGYQDINRMGGFFFRSPAIATQLTIAMANLCGFPLFLGYLFKKQTQMQTLLSLSSNSFLMLLMLVGFISSIYYFSKIVLSVLTDHKKNNFKVSLEHVKTGLFLFTQPVKSPKITFIIFWLIYLATIICVQELLADSLYSGSAVFTGEFTGITPKCAQTVPETLKKKNYFFFFYTLFFWCFMCLLLYNQGNEKKNKNNLNKLCILALCMLLVFLIY